MPLFKRGRAKSQPHSSTDESQKSWGVFRLFQNTGGSLMNKEPSAVCLMERSGSKQNSATNSTDNRSPTTFRFNNQHYSPEVALSPDPLPLVESTLPLQPVIVPTEGHKMADESKEQGPDLRTNDLFRYELWQQKKPRFHFGPRHHEDEEGSGLERRASQSESSGTSEHILTQPPKFAFIFQDGKFVEREVTHWPRPSRFLPHQRYRVMEPYATRYGIRYRKRLNSTERTISQRYRFIYQNPIYMLPRKVMEENKNRLMKWHSLKDSIEGPKVFAGPQKIDIGEQTQSKIIKKIIERHNIKEAENLVNYITAAKAKGRSSHT